MSYTLMLEPDVVQTAKVCASRRGTTLDSLIQAYLVTFVKEQSSASRAIIPDDSIVASISGVIHPAEDVSDKDLVSQAILEKYEPCESVHRL
jgi:hypothetical protein